ncbi:MAG: alanine racemase [Acidobacteria bacterium]|nr:alanine racemase [Acidobacteriota bacterium]
MPEQIPPRPTFARIDLDNLAFNLRSVRQFIGENIRCMAMVKANAYGHGAVECSRRLEKEGVEWFAAATLEEALELRDAGLRKRILCLGGFYSGQENAGLAVRITPAVFTIDAAKRLDRAAAERGETAAVHIKIDTGMGRVGVPFGNISEFADRLAELQNIEVEALMTHFAAADDLTENSFTARQAAQFDEAAAVFRDRGFQPAFIDLANSPGAIAHPTSRADMVRLGGVLYGLSGDVLPAGIEKPEIRPVLSLRTELAQVKHVARGTSIGYGRTFVATRESLIGTAPIGYGDGIRRSLAANGRAIVNGSVAPIVGRVSMDWITLDLTAVPDVSLGDAVTLIGSDGENSITAEDVARDAGTISYEITSGISARVPRRYAAEETA